MNKIRTRFQNLLRPPSIPAGMYHFQAPASDPRNYRLHLRVEPDGNGLLIVNAATILHLNKSAVDYAYYLIQNLTAEQVADQMVPRYRVRREDVIRDFNAFVQQIDTLVSTSDLDPELYLDFDRQTPFSSPISAPYRLDCALTYRLPVTVPAIFAPVERVKRELNTDEWKTILSKAWAAGIPHVVFTGGEPTLRDDLPELIAHAEINNMVSGLITDGLRLSEKAYLDILLQTGLDHLMIVLQPDQEKAWVALENVITEDLYTAVHLTLLPDNLDKIPDLIRQLAAKGVKALSLSTSELEFKPQLDAARDQIAASNVELVWNLPVPYSTLHPIAMELREHERPSGAGKAWIYVEPDGDVLPAQGENEVLGNLLQDPWEEIWRP